MSNFIDLGVSFFDDEFTLNPYPFLEPLYERKDILGFRADDMNFLFRHDDAREVMFDKRFIQAYDRDGGAEQREARYATLYPHRHKHFQETFNTGTPNLQLKALIVRFINEITEQISFAGATSVFTRLADGGRLDHYAEEVAVLPLRVFLTTAGIPFTEEEAVHLYWCGYRFLNSHANPADEVKVADAEQAIKDVWTFVEDRYGAFPEDSLIARFVEDALALGVSRDCITSNIGGFFIIALANTLGVSSAYLLRNTIRFPAARTQLAASPELMDREDTIIEFLRRDNHVKSMSRHANEAKQINGFDIAQGDNVYLFFPGVNLDPNHWQNPLTLDFSRQYTSANHMVFGGSMFSCIGRKLAISFMQTMLQGFVRYLPETAEVLEDEIEMDGSWVVERIIRKMPIVLN